MANDKLGALRAVPLFADLDERGLQAVAVLARETSVLAGEPIMLEGEPGDAFYVILEGTVRIEKGGRPIRSMTPGGFIGEIALLDRRPRTATAVAVTESRLLRLGQHEFERLVDTFPEVSAKVRAAISRRLRGPEPHLLS
ncbi:MAG TPA: cyclic nucleotide-binding domain-containing protein [Candidatus Deferrimicrobiaceae bacterium]|nr:cyclic nucleotide-binding domain-containing protein [Candidatus Deferrimicrobiaceae bacterium]